MKLSVRASAITSGLIWGGCMLTCGLINLAEPSYGRRFLKLMSSVYPGYRDSRTLPNVLVGTGYGFVDGAVAGAVFAALYNRFAERPGQRLRSAASPAGSSAPAVEI